MNLIKPLDPPLVKEEGDTLLTQVKEGGTEYNLTLPAGTPYRLNFENLYTPVSWKISNSDAAAMDEALVIYPRKEGEAKITIKAGSKTFTVNYKTVLSL